MAIERIGIECVHDLRIFVPSVKTLDKNFSCLVAVKMAERDTSDSKLPATSKRTRKKAVLSRTGKRFLRD